MRKIRVKDSKEFFVEIKKFVEVCFNKHLPNLKMDELEEKGKIYYMNDKDDTIFNVSMNKHLCYFMCFYNDGMGAIKVSVYMDGNIEAYLYNKKENKPFVTEKAKINSEILNDVALLLYVAADKKELYGKAIDKMNFNVKVTEEDKKVFYKSCGIVEIENLTAKRYIDELEKRYIDCKRIKEWNEFKDNRKKANIQDLKKQYPKVPASLLSLLEYSDGTSIYFLGSDVDKGTYPYYLLSVKDMLESKNMIKNNFEDFINRSVKEFKVDEKISNNLDNIAWIHFADCMNNGGTSQLFIDLTPSEKGVKGQIIRYLHDPDSLEVIANSFDEYLNRQIKNGLKFVSELEIKKEKTEEIVKEENQKNEKEQKIETKIENDIIPSKKLEMICTILIVMSFINIIMLFTKSFKSILTTIVLFIALVGIFASFVYSLYRLLKGRFNKELFNVLLIINMLFSLQYIGNFTILNIILILINLSVSAYGMNVVDKIK